MCPDRELLSAYVDGEVPEPWNGRLEGHIADCEACAKAVDGFRALSARIRSAGAEGFDESAALSRMRARMEAALSARGEPALPHRSAAPRHSAEFWRRRVALPLPAAAAAAVAVIALLALTLSGSFTTLRSAAPALAAAPQTGPIQAMATAAELPPPGGGQTISMDELLRYLESKNGQAALTIRLPSGASFDNSGTPVIQVAGPPQGSKGGAQ
ncbi:MAG TPA: zf-HC2 domain-containing protein [Rectinemataceae bacterium]|nr:zf-HC2 domain-containing protein [Rectinemataceae bacterium]